MASPGKQPATDHTWSECIASSTDASPNDASPSAAMSQAEEIVKLRQDIEVLQKEKKSAMERAATRYKDMMHANRRAERAEQALERESTEREGERMRSNTLVNSYKKTIEDFKQLAASNQAGPGDADMQTLQATNAALKGSIAHQQQTSVQAEMISQKTMQDRIDAYRTQAKNEAQQLAEMKRVNELLSHKTETKVSRLQAKLQTISQEKDRLRKQLQQSQHTVEWHKTQAQRLSAQRGGIECLPMAAGVHAGFPLQHQHSPVQVKETPGKRKRRESIGYVGMVEDPNRHADPCSKHDYPTPDTQRSGRKSTSNSLTTTPKQSLPSFSKKQRPSLRQPATPTRQSKIPEQQQHQMMYTSPQQPSLPCQPQAQLSPVHAKQAQQQNTFLQGFQPNNAGRAFAGIPQNLRPTLQQQAVGQQTHSQGFVQGGSQEPLLHASTPMEQQVFASLKAQTPLPSQQSGTQQMQLSSIQQQQGPFGNLHCGDVQTQQNLMPLLTSTYDTDLSSIFPKNAIQTQTTPFGLNGGIGDKSMSDRIPTQFGNSDFQLFPEVSLSRLNGVQPNDHDQLPDWGSLMPDLQGKLSGIQGSGEPLLDDLDFLEFINDPNADGLPEISSNSGPSMDPVVSYGGNSNEKSQQKSHKEASQQELPDFDLATLLASSPAVKQHPTTARKQPFTAPPARPTSVASGRSTPARANPLFPMCLHCHENWWNETCDTNEPCQNCIHSNTACERPKCLNFAKGACANTRCARVHEGDMRFLAVVTKPKTLKRIGKKDERKTSPVEMVGQ